MKRYTTKHFRRMEESEEGEWVRYEDLIAAEEDYRESTNYAWRLYQTELERNRELAKENEHLEARIVALFSIVMGTAAYAIAKLIGWSLGL